jgi:predicted Fe-Mo cluster-binding NifX family protein
MKVVVSSSGDSLDSPVSPVFGRAEYYLVVNTEDLSSVSLSNPATGQSSGAGIKAAQFILEQKPDALISSNIGPNAFQVLSAGSIECYTASGGSVSEAINAFKQGQLNKIGSPTAASHSGLKPGTEESDEEKLKNLVERLRELREQAASIIEQIDLLKKE